MIDEEIYKIAKKKVKAKKGFFYHFIAYACVLALLYAIMYFEKDGNLLPVVIVALSWGIGIAMHYFSVFGTEHLDFLGFSPNWEEEELQKEVDRLERKKRLKERIVEQEYELNELESLELDELEERRLDEDFR